MKTSLIGLTVILAGCAPMAEMIQNAGGPSVKTASTTEQSIDQGQLESYNGPKARVAVYRFGDRTGKGKGYSFRDHPVLAGIAHRSAMGWPKC